MKSMFIIRGREYSLLKFRYSFTQDTDSTGRPCSGIQCGFIFLEVNSASNTGLVELMGELDNSLTGKIACFEIETDQKVKEIMFNEGHIIHYEEIFSAEDENVCTEKITISARKIRIGRSEFDNNWLQ